MNYIITLDLWSENMLKLIKTNYRIYNPNNHTDSVPFYVYFCQLNNRNNLCLFDFY